jgi:RNA polymerase sigma-70 factor (ECF subfamily)
MTVLWGRSDLLQRFRSGERSALNEVYWAYVGDVEQLIRRGFALTRGVEIRGVGASSQLADLVQDVFVKAFSPSARTAYDGLRNYRPYLLTIARNVLIDWARRSNREISVDDSELEAMLAQEAPDEPPQQDIQMMNVVEEYVSTLPPVARDVYRERYVHCRSQNEAAETLSLSRQQIRTWEARLRKGVVRALMRAGVETWNPESASASPKNINPSRPVPV